MEIIVSAIMGELAGRSISFLIDKYSKPMAPTTEERLHCLQRLLLRVRVVVEEAEERHITNQAMLQQLNILRKEMYRGYYTLDSFRCQAHGENKVKDHEVSHSLAPSKFNPAKRVCLCSGSSQNEQGLLGEVLGSLELTIEGVSEFVMFLNTYPRFYRQPYCMYLLLNKCMFSRQIEMEHIINFLLQAETPGAENPGVLPIIGPGKAGKSTLVEHACNDERVRNHFSQIVFVTQGNLEDGNIATLRDGGVIKHQNHALDGERVLVIVELDGDRYSERLDENINEGLLGRLYSAYENCIPRDSKIIVTSRSDKIMIFGTTPPLRLQRLTPEAYWYFFKVLTFGSMDAEEHPKLASIAMDMAREFEGCFLAANIFSGLLRSNPNPRFWRLALATVREYKQKNLFMYGADQVDPWEVDKPGYNPRVTECFVIVDNYQTGSASAHSEAEAPKISVLDVLFGSARPRGRFDALAWKSQIPPHYSYMYSCEIRRPKRMVARKKRMKKIGT